MRSWVLALVWSLTLGCSGEEPSAPTSKIDPGQGLESQGQTLQLGGSLDEVRAALGASMRYRDLGALGARFEAKEHGVSGFVSGGAVTRLTIYPGFDGVTPAGVGVDSARSVVVAAYGDGVTDTFLGSSYYRERGLIIEYAADRVSRIHLVTPKP